MVGTRWSSYAWSIGAAREENMLVSSGFCLSLSPRHLPAAMAEEGESGAGDLEGGFPGGTGGSPFLCLSLVSPMSFSPSFSLSLGRADATVRLRSARVGGVREPGRGSSQQRGEQRRGKSREREERRGEWTERLGAEEGGRGREGSARSQSVPKTFTIARLGSLALAFSLGLCLMAYLPM